MYTNIDSFVIFSGPQVKDFLEKQKGIVQRVIENAPSDQLLNASETVYINYVLQQYISQYPTIYFDDMWISDVEMLIPNKSFSLGLASGHITPREYTRQVILYHLPFTPITDASETFFFHYAPNSINFTFPEVCIIDNCICFEIINYDDDKNAIKQQEEHNISTIKEGAMALKNAVEMYGSNRAFVERVFHTRRQRLLKNKDLLASLDVPLKKREGMPSTYNIPSIQNRKSLPVNPSSTERGFKPEPTLDQTTYQEILQISHHMGKVFETLPATYINKGEEDLRDHLLLFLTLWFKDEGSVTGETFNKTGKTDILYRYKNSNVFVAECKFWKGQVQYIETINQLLGYLTWRDSKVAVIIFVTNNEISSVLEAVKRVTPEHPNYLGFVNGQDVSWLNYRFHINSDPNREVEVAVMLFHIPAIYSGRVRQKRNNND